MFRPSINNAIKIVCYIYSNQTRTKKHELAQFLYMGSRSIEYSLYPLVQADIVTAYRGRLGGYELTHEDVTLDELLMAFDYSEYRREKYSTMLLSAPVIELLRWPIR